MRYDKLFCVVLHGYLWTEVWGSYIVFVCKICYVTEKNIELCYGKVMFHYSSTSALHPLCIVNR